jgi:hypothetical protein
MIFPRDPDGIVGGLDLQYVYHTAREILASETSSLGGVVTTGIHGVRGDADSEPFGEDQRIMMHLIIVSLIRREWLVWREWTWNGVSLFLLTGLSHVLSFLLSSL